MTPGQTSIPHGDREYPNSCAWCGHSPAAPYELEKARYTKAANGQRVVKRAALVVPACDVHRRQFDSQRDAG